MPKITKEEAKALKEEEISLANNIKETLKEKGWFKIMNLERPGDPIEIGFLGQPLWQFEDGAEDLIPVAVANALNNTVKTYYKTVDNKMVAYERNRYQAFPSQKKEEEIKNDESKSELAEALKNKKKK